MKKNYESPAIEAISLCVESPMMSNMNTSYGYSEIGPVDKNDLD